MHKAILKLGVFVIATAIATAACALAIEAVFRFGIYSAEQRRLGVSGLYTAEVLAPRSADLAHATCTFDDLLIAHPFLTFVYHPFPPCRLSPINLQGFKGNRDLPLETDPRYFTILVTGGSVAEQLATFGPDSSRIYLEDILNESLESPTGKPFRILNGAIAATSRPGQNISALLYGDAVDAIITIDGVNEASTAHDGGFLYNPAQAYKSLIISPVSREVLARRWIAARVRSFFRDRPLLRASYAAHWAQRQLVGALLGADVMPQIHEQKQSTYWVQFNSPGWPREKMDRWNKAKYKTFVRSSFAHAQVIGARYAHFLQPAPAFKRHLTQEERAFPLVLARRDYQIYMDAVDELRAEGVPAYSLVHAFDDETRMIYGDSAHCAQFGAENPGYSKLSRLIAGHLAETWGLARRAPPRRPTAAAAAAD